MQTITTHLKYLKKRHACIKNRYKYIVFPNDNVLRLSLRDTINGIFCPKNYGSSLPKWKGVLRKCVSYPKYNTPNHE